MKKCILSAALILLLKMSHAQYSLVFCESIGAESKPLKVSNLFSLPKNGGLIDFYVKADERFNTNQLSFVIYYVNAEGNEEELVKLPQKIEASWNYAWKEVVLFNAGTYRVKVYNQRGTYLTSANLNIKNN